MKRNWIVVIMIIVLQMVVSPVALSAQQIALYDTKQSGPITTVKRTNKMMLKQDWYGMNFEIDTSKKMYNKDLKEVNKDEYTNALKGTSFWKVQPNKDQELKNQSVAFNVYFLDYRLKDYSSAMALSFLDKSIVVFGTYRDMSKQEIHRLAVHEMGHQVDFQLMNESKWKQYKEIRGIEDKQKYSNSSNIYNQRPQEIFAEDFRLIFGGQAAKKTQHLNNQLPDPTKSKELRDFYLSLIANS